MIREAVKTILAKNSVVVNYWKKNDSLLGEFY